MCNNQSNPNPFLLLKEVFQKFGQDYVNQSRAKVLPSHIKVLNDVMKCGTEAMGRGYIQFCNCCQDKHVVYNCCQNRFCPKCHMIQKNKWWKNIKSKLPHCSYSFVTLAISTSLHDIFYQHQGLMYGLLIRAGAKAIEEYSKKSFDGLPAIIAVIQTWNKKLDYHPHVHYIVSNGGGNLDGWSEPKNPHWIPTTQVMRRAKEIFLELLLKEQPTMYSLVEKLIRGELWEVNCQPYGTEQIYNIDEDGNKCWDVDHDANLEKLLKYISRDCLAGHRIMDIGDENVTIQYEDRDGQWVEERIPGVEYIRSYARKSCMS